MKQRYLVIDVALCFDCNNCFLACKDEFVENEWLPSTNKQPRHGHRWMNILRRERGQHPRIDVAYLPMPCQHCQDAPCMKAHPDCISRREDGIVLIDAKKAKGKKDLAASCPYDAIYWNEEESVCQKCTLCAHLLDEGELRTPRCVHSCPTEAAQFYTLEPDEANKKAAAEGWEQYRPDYKTRPNVYYKNLYRFTKFFITGALLRQGDCAEGVNVTLRGPNVQESQRTDYFGEFKFDALLPGAYTLEAEGRELAKVELTKALNVGELTL